MDEVDEATPPPDHTDEATSPAATTGVAGLIAWSKGHADEGQTWASEFLEKNKEHFVIDVGERLYRPPDRPDRSRFPRQALHALRIGVVHPATGLPLVVESPVAPDLARLLRQLRERSAGR